ncbi:unnamed protein product, partial [Vitrella brassicaformis CCMP3155]
RVSGSRVEMVGGQYLADKVPCCSINISGSGWSLQYSYMPHGLPTKAVCFAQRGLLVSAGADYSLMVADSTRKRPCAGRGCRAYVFWVLLLMMVAVVVALVVNVGLLPDSDSHVSDSSRAAESSVHTAAPDQTVRDEL